MGGKNLLWHPGKEETVGWGKVWRACESGTQRPGGRKRAGPALGAGVWGGQVGWVGMGRLERKGMVEGVLKGLLLPEEFGGLCSGEE